MKSTVAILTSLLLCFASSCVSDRGAQSAPSPTPAAAIAAPAAPASRPITNRDALGPPDVAKYIAGLQSAGRMAELQVDLVIQKLALAPDAVVADLGCGPGVFALPLGRACPAGLVYAGDVEPAQLDALRERINAERVDNVIPVLCSPANPHLPPGRLDLVFIADTYHHFDERVAYMRKLAACLKPGGRVAILDYKPGVLPVGPPADHKLGPGVRERELAEAGYELVESFATHTWQDFEIWRPAAAR